MKPTPVRHNADAPAAAQAAQVAFAVMALAKKPTWSEVVSDPASTTHIRLTPVQQQLLEEHRGILPYLSRGGRAGTLRTVIACGTCNGVGFTAGAGAAPARCPFTLGCAGTTHKAKTIQERAVAEA